MSPEEESELESMMLEALGRVTDAQIDEVSGLLLKQALAVRSMRDQPPSERMKLAMLYTELRQKSDLIWMVMLGLSMKVVRTPEGDSKALAYSADTGEPVFGTMEFHPLDAEKKRT